MNGVTEEKFELRISDNVVITKNHGEGFTITAIEPGLTPSRKDKKVMVTHVPNIYYYLTLWRAIKHGLHIAIELENPNSVQKYTQLLAEFLAKLDDTTKFVEGKYKIVKYSKVLI